MFKGFKEKIAQIEKRRGRPAIAASFYKSIKAAKLLELQERGLDIAELRIDLFSNHNDILYLKKFARQFTKIPTIATVRHSQEGGNWCDITPQSRRDIFKAIAPYVSALDIELNDYDGTLSDISSIAKSNKNCLIVSSHNLHETPNIKIMEKQLKTAKNAGADIFKIVTTAQNLDDIRRLGRFVSSYSSQGLLAIAMGNHSTISRILFPGLGSIFTFAKIGQKETGLGQLPLTQTVRLLDKIYSKEDIFL